MACVNSAVLECSENTEYFKISSSSVKINFDKKTHIGRGE